MLSPGDFSVGYIGDTESNLTLVLSRGRYEFPMLVTRACGSPYAIFLSGEFQFAGFECGKNDSWKGVLVPNVNIEIDEESVFDAERLDAPLGALVRRNTQLEIVTRVDRGLPRAVSTPLVLDLPPCRQNMSAGFSKWGIFLGEGTKKRKLMTIEIGSTPANQRVVVGQPKA